MKPARRFFKDTLRTVMVHQSTKKKPKGQSFKAASIRSTPKLRLSYLETDSFVSHFSQVRGNRAILLAG
jgi:hypothetical protein